MGQRASLILAIVAACNDPVLLGRTATPVPPVHRLPADLEGSVVVVAEDAEIETKEPIHIARAKQMHVPQDYRASMENAFALAGFRVVHDAAAPHDVVAKLALAVSEDDGNVHQVYRCYLKDDAGAPVARIDWAWPENTRVDVYEVYDFATHHLATEVVTSRAVVAWLREHGKRGASGAP